MAGARARERGEAGWLYGEYDDGRCDGLSGEGLGEGPMGERRGSPDIAALGRTRGASDGDGFGDAPMIRGDFSFWRPPRPS